MDPVNPDGTLRPESSLGPNVKFFENIINADEPPARSIPPYYRNLGVLLIGPTS